MAGKKREVVVPVEEVSKDELVARALNEPDANKITVGGKEFDLKDFKYKEYIAFVRFLAPMFDTFLGGNSSLSLNGGSKLNALGILEFCETDLPKMASMVAHNTYPDMTEEELLEVAPSPFDLSELVIAQIGHNRIIEKLAGFLQVMTPRTTV